MFRLTLASGAVWAITLSDILLALGMLLLLLEIMKGARPGSKYLTDHLLSLILFGAAVAEFVMWPKFGTSTFFLLSLMAMVDFFGGIALRAAPRWRGDNRLTAGCRSRLTSRSKRPRRCPNRSRTSSRRPPRPPPHPWRHRPPRLPNRCCRSRRSRRRRSPPLPPPNRRRRFPLRNYSPALAPRRRPTRRSADLQIVCRVETCNSRMLSSDER